MLAACGTRLPDEAFEAEGELRHRRRRRGRRPTAPPSPAQVEGSTETTVAGEADDGGGDGGGTTGGTAGGRRRRRRGRRSQPGVGRRASPPNQIVIGNIIAENGVLGDAFAPAARGMRAWAAAINAKGGIHGRQVVLKTCDDGEDRNKTLECARRLVEQDKVFAIVGTNTRAMGGAAQYLNDKGVPVIGMPITNSLLPLPALLQRLRRRATPATARPWATTASSCSPPAIYRWFKQNLKVIEGRGVQLRHPRVEAGRRRLRRRASSSRASR